MKPHALLDVPKNLIGSQSYSCAGCHEAFLFLRDMDPTERARFDAWQAKHGVDCDRPPLLVITPTDLVALALLNAPSH